MTQEGRIIFWLNNEYGEGNDNVKIVRAALEKQIPQKVNISLKGTTEWNTKCHCPMCRKDLFDGQKYCSNCGQLIDWGEGGAE